MPVCTALYIEALNREDTLGTVYGMINGIEGFLHDQIMDMKPLEQSGELELIKQLPILPRILPLQATGRFERSGLSGVV